MNLAYGLPDSSTEWFWFLGALALYVGVGLLLDYAMYRRRGARNPARKALGGLTDMETRQPPGSRFRSQMLLLGGALLLVPVALWTSGAVRYVSFVVVGAAVICAKAVYDHRTEVRPPERR
ncbi:hypothetical protein [Streptomyces sp. SP18CS02]|uniref:hypothetical protein n=1 Tax=Streptomyces sp. SP18CS02 TaxID=3002531 RepID=UPI002E767C39|nr:hypothetical protein [Streptomyces sp. SP18CS02]MEE1755655.1 hypothetical protein [Streptomyces sp. SP18CS02]